MSKFYITTAIDYANSSPHLGTAYEKIGADVIARYQRLCGSDVYFLMGNDEHSQNVRKKAEELNLDPKEYCDKMAAEFQATWKELHISNDFFIQTTSPVHHEVVRDLALRIYKAKDTAGRPIIYQAPYEGHYCVSCEAFYDEKDLVNGVCPNHKTKPEWIKENNYFFRLSSFSKELKTLLEENPDFARPESRRNELLALLNRGLEDISISRANKTWGVKLPFDESAVAYVWFDALINYMSALGPIGGEMHKKYWPVDLHVIGKDITRFHCLIWPAMLMAAGLPLPKSVWAHGFVSIAGEKMSKSRGNVADPRELAKTYGAEVLRYHLMREVPWDKDGDFSVERLTARYNADLANDLGNLVSRTLTMVQKYIGSKVEKVSVKNYSESLNQIEEVLKSFREKMDRYAIYEALDDVWKLISDSNILIGKTQPWSMAKEGGHEPKIAELFYVLLERIRWGAVFLLPVMPEKAREILTMLGTTSPQSIQFTPTAMFRIQAPRPLFPRMT